MSWRPGWLALGLLTVATVVGLWLLSPPWWGRIGADSRVFYAAARLSDQGGNPYAFDLLQTEEAAIDRQETPASDRQAFTPAPYAYPPLMTAFWQAFDGLGDRAFYATNAVILLLAGGLGFWMLLPDGLPRRDALFLGWAFLVSAPFVLGLQLGNPSDLLFLGWASAILALTRGRPTLAGVLAATTLVKAPIGLALVVAMIAATPAMAPGLLLGFGAGTSLFLAFNTIVLGPATMALWLESLPFYSATLGGAGVAAGQCCLAGLPGLFLNRLGVAWALGLSLLVVGGVVALALRSHAARRAYGADSSLRLALLTAAALALSPYLHLNDLVLEAFPLLVVATRRLTVPGQVTLALWGAGVALPLIISLVIAALVRGQAVSSVGFGILISGLTLVAVAGLLDAERASVTRGPVKPWGPVAST